MTNFTVVLLRGNVTD